MAIALSRLPYAPSYRGFCRFARDLGLELWPHQRKLARALLEGQEREVVACWPRGTLKSTTAAALAVHHVLSVPDASVYIGASSKPQAQLIGQVVRNLAEHQAIAAHLTLRHDSIRLGDRKGPTVLSVVASDGGGAHGWLHPTLMIGDELHLWADREPSLLSAMVSALIKNPAARFLGISTAPASTDSPLGRLRERALASPVVKRKGVELDASGDGLRWLELSLPDDVSADDFRMVAKANPLRTEAQMREQHRRVTPLVWEQLHCNRSNIGTASWLPVGAWSSCRADYDVADQEPRVIGVDIGGSRSASAIVSVVGNFDDLRVAEVYALQGTESVLDAVEVLRGLAARHPIRAVVYDPQRFASEALRLERELGLRMVEWPQSTSRVTVMSERLLAAVVEHRLRHRGDRALDLHVANAVAKPTGRGWRLYKSSETAQIDCAVSLAMACEVAATVKRVPRVVGWL